MWIVVVSLVIVGSGSWLIFGGGRWLQLGLGLWALTGRRKARGGMIDAIFARQESAPDRPPSSREFFPSYRPMDVDTQRDLVTALRDVCEPISITEARATAKALGVRVDLRNLAGELVASVEPGGAVLAPRQREQSMITTTGSRRV